MNLLRERLWDRIIDGPDTGPEDVKEDMKFHEDLLNCIKNRDLKAIRPIIVKRFTKIQKGLE